MEGFHTYFVSDLGLLVHNTCYTEGLKTNRALDLDASSPNPAVQGNQWHPRLVEDRSAGWARLAADIESRPPSLPIPQATNPVLQSYINTLYKGTKMNNPIGNGSTAAAIKHERLTGTDVFGKPLAKYNVDGHTDKGELAINRLNRFLNEDDLSDLDRHLIQNELDSIHDALNTKQKH